MLLEIGIPIMGLYIVCLLDNIDGHLRLSYPPVKIQTIDAPTPTLTFVCNPKIDTYEINLSHILELTLILESKHGNL